jgi:hypothetical protein
VPDIVVFLKAILITLLAAFGIMVLHYNGFHAARQLWHWHGRVRNCRRLHALPDLVLAVMACSPLKTRSARTYHLNSKKRRLSAPGLREQCPI